jgi:hypothetical protein
MSSSKTRGMVQSDLQQVAQMCKLLWPDVSVEEHARERDACLRSGKFGTLPGAILVS